MITFDAADFSERRSEEVISFFWRSVYILDGTQGDPWETQYVWAHHSLFSSGLLFT